MKKSDDPFSSLLSLMESTITSGSTTLVVVNGHTFDELRLENNEESQNKMTETVFVDGQAVAELSYGGGGITQVDPIGGSEGQHGTAINLINLMVDALTNGEVVTRGR